MKSILILTLAVLLSTSMQAQENQYLRELTESVKKLRKAKDNMRDKVIADLSIENKPRISLMDDIKGGGDEYKGQKANRFRMNQVFVFVYEKQNHKMESTPIFLNSKERGINYSGIEKSVLKGGRVKYTISEHIGNQEFVIVPYHPSANYKVTISDEWHKPVEKEATDVCTVKLNNVRGGDKINIIIEYIGDKSNKEPFESFAILNYNPQKR